MKKLLVLIPASLLLFACGKDPSETPNTTQDKSSDPVYSNVFTVSGKNTQTFNVHKKKNCHLQKAKKLNQSQLMEKYQQLCQQAAPIAEGILTDNCTQLGGTVENLSLSSNTKETFLGHCQTLHCEISATASCGVE